MTRKAAELGSPGTADALERELVGVDDGDVAAVAVDGDAGSQQHPLGVIAAARGLADGGGAVGGEGGEQDARLDLGACDLELVGDGAQARAAHVQGREAPLSGLQLGAHLGERLGDPVDRAAADGLIAVERERAPVLRGEPAGQQAHQRAGVADVDRLLGLARLAQAGAAYDEILAVHLDEGAEGAHGVERGVGVGGVQVALDAHGLGGHGAEQGGAMGDRLVGRRAQLAGESARWLEAHVHRLALMLARLGSRGRR